MSSSSSSDHPMTDDSDARVSTFYDRFFEANSDSQWTAAFQEALSTTPEIRTAACNVRESKVSVYYQPPFTMTQARNAFLPKLKFQWDKEDFEWKEWDEKEFDF
jgi:hypothetical protein